MDFSELYEAIKSDDQQAINDSVTKLFPVLMSYLRVNMHADSEDAKDCIQQALLHTTEKIREDKIRNPSKLYYYLIRSCKNIYLRMNTYTNISIEDNNKDYAIDPPKQLDELLDEEKQRILSHCLEQLDPNHRDFINYWFENPDIDASSVARHFDISLSNAWTRKHRIIKILNKCYEKNSHK
ncbi:MAG TPA: sigma-70 family RNA polymerase sigma factor [Balneolales bacterium]|nr:sigma-70 family RNA polymerase sigma factor [Balneolales bacterium]